MGKTNINKCIRIIGELEKASRRERRKFEITPTVVQELANLYASCSREDRHFLQECLRESKAGLTLVFKTSEISAMAIETRSSEWLKVGLLIHIMEGFSWDPRENQ